MTLNSVKVSIAAYCIFVDSMLGVDTEKRRQSSCQTNTSEQQVDFSDAAVAPLSIHRLPRYERVSSQGTGLILTITAIFLADRRFHLGLVVVHLGYQLWWVSLLFDTPAIPTIVG